MPQFRIRSLLLVTVVVAVAMLSLARPSAEWLLAWPCLVSGLIIVVVNQTLPISRNLLFWVSFVIGVMAFLTATIFVQLIAALTFAAPSMELNAIASTFWQLFHGKPSPSPGNGRPASLEFAYFAVSVHMILSIVWSAALTFVTQILISRRKPR